MLCNCYYECATWIGWGLFNAVCSFGTSCIPQGRIRGGGDWGYRPPLKPTKVTFFTMILYNSERHLTAKYYWNRPPQTYGLDPTLAWHSSAADRRASACTWQQDVTAVVKLTLQNISNKVVHFIIHTEFCSGWSSKADFSTLRWFMTKATKSQ